jgi:hypothetical protein
MSHPLSDFFDAVTCTPIKKVVYVEYSKNDYDLMDRLYFIPVKNPTNKELRLALDLIDELYPLFRTSPIESKSDALQDVFKISTTCDRLRQMSTMRKIVFKRLISTKNNKIIFKRVLKH